MADFTVAFVRRMLEPRLRGHGVIEVECKASRYTIWHSYTSEWNGRSVKMPIAQLRAIGTELQLFWKRTNGRWSAYGGDGDRPFVETLGACLREIERDHWHCFWG